VPRVESGDDRSPRYDPDSPRYAADEDEHVQEDEEETEEEFRERQLQDLRLLTHLSTTPGPHQRLLDDDVMPCSLLLYIRATAIEAFGLESNFLWQDFILERGSLEKWLDAFMLVLQGSSELLAYLLQRLKRPDSAPTLRGSYLWERLEDLCFQPAQAEIGTSAILQQILLQTEYDYDLLDDSLTNTERSGLERIYSSFDPHYKRSPLFSGCAYPRVASQVLILFERFMGTGLAGQRPIYEEFSAVTASMQSYCARWHEHRNPPGKPTEPPRIRTDAPRPKVASPPPS
jgi:hypothetical protein